jgi:hypothetical protein
VAYQTVVSMAGDQDLLYRVAACAAEQGANNPLAWAQNHMWHVVKGQDWQNAWQYALDTNVENPGANAGVINDAMILSAVQARILATRPAPV